MTVSTGNKRLQVTLPQPYWDSLQDEAERQGRTLSQVIQAHVEASQRGVLSEGLHTAEVLQQVLTRLDRLVELMEGMEAVAVEQVSKLPAPPGPQPPALPPQRRGWFRRGA